MHISEEYIRNQINEIIAWESEEPWLVTRAVNFLTAPIAWGVQKIIPQIALKGLVHTSDWIASQITTEQWILDKNGLKSINQVRDLPLDRQDQMADEVHNWAIGIATAEGGVTGAIGLPGLVADIPAVMTLAFRTIRQIGLCYGHELKSDEDFEFLVTILSMAGAASMEEKTASLLTLQGLKTTLNKTTWKAMEEVAKNNPITREALLVSLKRVLKTIGVRLTKEKALQAVPIIGAGVGGASNLAFIRSVGWAARRAFQRKILEENGYSIVHPSAS